jgi:hypothetical protein
MPRFYLNEREIVPPPEIKSLDEILNHVDGNRLPANSAVRQVCIDGNSVIPVGFSGDLSDIIKRIDASEKVEIVTGTVEEIVGDSISEAFAYIERAEEGIRALARHFQSNPGPQALECLYQLCEGFYWLHVLLSKLSANFQIFFDDLTVQGISAGDHRCKFISVLRGLLDSLERSDMTQISNLLNNEILSLVAIWKIMFQTIANSVGIKR